jgi:hypothetical protein
MYAAATSACGTYSYYTEGQACQAGGTWSGTYTLASPPSSTTRTRYAAQTSSCGTYGSASQTQTCQSSGSFDGTYTLTSAPAASTRTAYIATSVACGSTCTSQNQTCLVGGWNNTYTATSCSVNSCGCTAGSTSGYSYGTITAGGSTAVSKNVEYRSSGGYYNATANCASGTLVVTISGESGPYANSGYRCTSGAWYQTTFGYYNVCLLNCSAGSTNGYSYGALNSGGTGSSQAVSKSITGGSCSGTASCMDGSVSITGESCSCNGGYYLSGTTCVACAAGTYSAGGTVSSCTACPAGSTSSAAASSCYCSEYNGTYNHYKYYDCDSNMGNGCETLGNCGDKGYYSCPSQIGVCGTHTDGYCCNTSACTGNSTFTYLETASNAYADCGWCGDGVCTAGQEGSWGCYADCGGDVCSDNSSCTGYSNSYCTYQGFGGGYCNGGQGYCNGCTNDQYWCDMCGSWVVIYNGVCECY